MNLYIRVGISTERVYFSLPMSGRLFVSFEVVLTSLMDGDIFVKFKFTIISSPATQKY